MILSEIQAQDSLFEKDNPVYPMEFDFIKAGGQVPSKEWTEVLENYFKVRDKWKGYKTWANMNFAEKAMRAGFAPTPSDYRPNDNFFGVSTYSPDAQLKKGGKVIAISFGGQYCQEFWRMGHGDKEPTHNTKLIGLINSGKPIYVSFDGLVPSNELLESFLF